MSGLPRTLEPNLLVGYDSSDDAAVYRLTDELALIQTVDFFPPVVDDPYDFGQIAAANALSDVYAMGGEPRLAMNLLAVPSCLPREAVGAILEGGAAKVAEAGAVTAGGHSIEDAEPKYGLCVSGLVHPGAVLTNRGAREGDLLVLTKPLGTGILTTAAKAELLSGAEYRAMTDLMAALNRDAARAAVPLRPSACTDVTGFGLIGHAREMAEGAGCTIELWPGRVPIVPQALELARDGIIPAGAYRNLEFAGPEVETAGTFPQAVLGAELEIPTIDGKVKYTLPAGTQSGTTFRLKGQGIPSINGRGRGDQYVTVYIETPKNLNKEQKEALKKFAETMGESNYEEQKKFFKKFKK